MEGPEQDFLQSLTPALREATDQWPEFSIKDVRIASQVTNRPISLLSARVGHAVRVAGRLEEIDPAHMHLVRNSNYRNVSLMIEDVSTYSFSQWEDGTFGFWAGGKAGWYEIAEPAKEYQKVFEEMNEAIGMFYFATDKFRKSRKVYSCAPPRVCEDRTKEWFSEYLKCKHCSRADVEDVRDGFYQHREFLIKSMLEGQKNLPWEASPILRHLKFQFPVDFIAIQDCMATAKLEQSLFVTENLEKAAAISNTMDIQGSNFHRHNVPIGASNNTATTDSGSRYLRMQVTATSSGLNGTNVIADGTKERTVQEVSFVHKGQSALRPRDCKLSLKSLSKPRSLEPKTSVPERHEAMIPRRGLPKEIYRPLREPQPSSASHSSASETPATNSGPEAISNDGLQISGNRLGDTPLPSYYDPDGPGGTWTCPYSSCNRKIWGARDVESIEMIKQHSVSTHAGKVVDLIHGEIRPWVSIDHLLARVNRVSSLQARRPSQLGGLPSRIIRRY